MQAEDHVSFCTTAGRRPQSRLLLDGVQHDHRDLALGLALIVGIGWPEFQRLVPEPRPFRARGGPRPRLQLLVPT